MKKSRKLVLNRETLHSLDLRDVAGAMLSLGPCTTLATTTRETNTSNTYTGTGITCDTNGLCSDKCTTGGACTT